MDKRVKLIVNSLKCPLCKAQIEGYDVYAPNAKSTSFNFHCVSNYYDYRFWMPYDDYNAPKIEYDMVHLYEGKFKYHIDQRYKINRTRIDMFEVDLEHNIKDETKGKNFQYDKILFDYPNTNRTKIVNRLKTILTFQ